VETLIGAMCMGKRIKFQFTKPGFHTLVVDNSALGYQKYGLPVGGPMDELAAEMANWLVGNQADSPLFEITLIGPEIIFKEDCQIAITGANLSPQIDGIDAPLYETICITQGQNLRFGKLISGCRTYLAIRGKWIQEGQSALEKATIERLNTINIEKVEWFDSLRNSERPKLTSPVLVVKVQKGPEFELLSKSEKSILFETTFTLLQDSNRMGYRLSPKLPAINQSIISSGVVPGTLQITEDGFPILLMKDAPATGGYLRALNVVSKDLFKLGQLKPGGSIFFQLLE